MMAAPGIPTTRYFDAATLPKDQIQQRDRLKAMMIFGHGGNTVTRMPEAVKGLEAMDLMVIADPHPTTFAVLANRRDNTYLLPIATQFECDGSRTASNRSVQWGSRVVAPIFESKTDYEALYRLAGAMDRAAERQGQPIRFQSEIFKRFEIRDNAPTAESILREINRGAISTGYTGQSPERLKLHMEHQDKFDLVTLRGRAGTPVEGDFYGMPWPAWGKPEWKHPGSHILYNTSLHVKEGGGTFRPRFGVERNGVTLLAEGSWSKGSDIQDGYPEFTTAVLRRLGWYEELTAEERGWIESNGGNFSWATDLTMGIIRVAMEHGCVPYGNGKARAVAWNLPDPVPVHREPIYTPRTDLLAQYPTLPDRAASACRISARACRRARTRSRATSRSSSPPAAWSNTRAAARRRGPTSGSPSCSRTCSSRSTRPTRRAEHPRRPVGLGDGPREQQPRAGEGAGDGARRARRRLHALPLRRLVPGRGPARKYPQGTDPIVLGESVNAVTTYGYDPVTFMQETKVTLCQIRAA
jgi:formate dehydrogenase major subunit